MWLNRFEVVRTLFKSRMPGIYEDGFGVIVFNYALTSELISEMSFTKCHHVRLEHLIPGIIEMITKRLAENYNIVEVQVYLIHTEIN